jgi:HK97 family phage prohead protease
MIFVGTVCGIASAVCVLQNNTFLQRGVFGDTLPATLPLLFRHEAGLQIGNCHPRETTAGDIEIAGDFFLDDEQPKQAHILQLLRSQMIRGLSVAYEVIASDQISMFASAWIRRGKLLEVSLCERGGNPHAVIRAIQWHPANSRQCEAFWRGEHKI